MLFKKLALIAMLSTALLTRPSYAVTLDNSSTINGSSCCLSYPYSRTFGEVFTSPLTGILESFTLYINGADAGALYGAVGTWNGGSAFGVGYGSPTLLYQSAFVSSNIYGAYTFNANIILQQGQQYVAYLSIYGVPNGISHGHEPISTTNNTPYIDYFVWNNDGGTPNNNASWDYFRNFGSAQFTANIAAAPVIPIVPESSTWLMMLLGFAGLGLARYRQAKSGANAV